MSATVSDTVVTAGSPDTASTVSVVIPCLNEADHLVGLLDAVRAQTAVLHEVIVVDNGSRDGSQGIVEDYQRRYAPWPLRLVTCARPGAAAALNVGIATATGEVIVRFDGHCVPHPNYIEKSLGHLGDASVGVVGGVWEIAPGAATAEGRAIATALTHRLATGGAEYRHPEGIATPRAVDTVPFGSFRKSLWQQLGGFDERLTINEDYVLNYRARLAGYRVLLDPAIRSMYFARGSFKELTHQYFRYGWVKAAMLKQHPSAIRARQLIPAIFVAGLIILSVLSSLIPSARTLLVTVVACHAVIVLAAGWQLAHRTRRWLEWPLYAVTFVVIQLAWGGGACMSALNIARRRPWETSPGQSVTRTTKPTSFNL